MRNRNSLGDYIIGVKKAVEKGPTPQTIWMGDWGEISDYVDRVRKAVEKGQSPHTIWISKGRAREMCEGLENIHPSILAFFNDESLPDSTMIKFHGEKE